VVSTFGWRWVFLGIIPLAVAVAALAIRPMRHYGAAAFTGAPSRIPHAVAAAGGVGAMATGLQMANPVGAVVLTLAGGGTAWWALRTLLPAGIEVARNAAGTAKLVGTTRTTKSASPFANFDQCSAVLFQETVVPQQEALAALAVTLRLADGSIRRRADVLAAFKRQHPCPANGATTGACPGWAMDHIVPLVCGGCDEVSNLQWLPNQIKSAAGIYPKDRWEQRVYCKG
jgi:hypothetical protein